MRYRPQKEKASPIKELVFTKIPPLFVKIKEGFLSYYRNYIMC